MELQKIIEEQIAAAIAALAQAKEMIADPAMLVEADVLKEIDRCFGLASFHISDIRFNCTFLPPSARAN
jgi:hypothetical protein